MIQIKAITRSGRPLRTFVAEIRPLKRSVRLAVSGTATRGPSRDAGGTHRRQGAADDCLCGGDEARQAGNRELFAELQAKGPDGYCQQHNTDALDMVILLLSS